MEPELRIQINEIKDQLKKLEEKEDRNFAQLQSNLYSKIEKAISEIVRKIESNSH